MWHFYGGGVKKYSDPSYIFSEGQDPPTSGSTPLVKWRITDTLGLHNVLIEVLYEVGNNLEPWSRAPIWIKLAGLIVYALDLQVFFQTQTNCENCHVHASSVHLLWTWLLYWINEFKTVIEMRVHTLFLCICCYINIMLA